MSRRTPAARRPAGSVAVHRSVALVDRAFAAEWNGLEPGRRRQIRRLVRIGQAQENRLDARLACAFAAYQRSRSWYRWFWLWLVPLAVAGVIVGLGTHPIVLGVVLGSVVSAVMVRRNFRRVDAVNADLLNGT